MTKVKDPPIWQDGQSYEDYKKEIKVWQLIKSASDVEEGPYLFRALKGKARDAANELTIDEIGSKDGLKLILAKLDTLYEADKNQRIYTELEGFEKFKRSNSMTMSDYLVEFERRHTKLKSDNCVYPDGVLAYKVLQGANLSSEHASLCKATINTGGWSYTAVKAQIKKIFSDVIPITSEVADKPIKLETTYYTNHQSNEGYDDYADNCLDDDSNQVRGEIEEHDIYYGRFSRSGNSRGNYYSNQNRQMNMQRYPQKQSSYNGPGSNNQGRRYIDININKLKDSYNKSPNIPNPKDNRGMYTTCRKCRSIYHWQEDCPHATNNQDSNTSQKSKVYYGNDPTDEIIISLFQNSSPVSTDEVLCLVGETLNMAVIDSGCPTTVCGDKWYSNYMESMSEEEKHNVKTEDSKAVYRFGDSAPSPSLKKVFLPITINDMNMYLPTDVVEVDVPLLLSKETLKKGKAVTDFEKETIKIYNSEQPMICTTSGHYAIPIRPHNAEMNANVVMHVVKAGSNMKSIARQLHVQLGHPSAHRLIKFVRNAGEDNKDLIQAIEDVASNCDICKRYKKTAPRPVVTFPLASVFNETVAMDLKIYKNNSVYFLHVIDHATRFSAAGVIKSKSAETIIKKFFEIWISVFGTPQTVLSDNGGEFVNKQFEDLCHNLNIRFITTAAEAPWSNGLVEKHNGLIGDAVLKIVEDVKCSVDIALCWAVNAKNSLQNISGFSPYQLVFGRNPNLPSALTDRLPALEGVTASKLISDQLNALHIGRQEAIKAESSEKLRRALRSKIRTHNDIKYFQGEEVFYKHEDVKRWKGPGKVLAQDGSKVLIKIPTGLISVHSSRVILTTEAEQNRKVDEDAENSNLPSELEKNKKTDEDNLCLKHPSERITGDLNVTPQQSDESSDKTLTPESLNQESEEFERDATLIIDEERPPNLNKIPSQDHNFPVIPFDGDLHDLPPDDVPSSDLPSQNIPPSPVPSCEVPQHNVLPIHPEEINPHEEVFSPQVKVLNIKLPNVKQVVEYKTVGSENWKRCRILSRGGKASGKNRNFLNVKDVDDNTEQCIDWQNSVEAWNTFYNRSFLASIKDPGYDDAKLKELEKWKNMGVYEVVEDEGQCHVTARWVCSEKIVEGKTVKKARLVARGYEDNIDGIATDSPTINKESLRVAYMTIASMGWEINSLDVTAAFLQGRPLSRDVYLKPPREAGMKGKLWKLLQCVYGLNDASRNFYLKVKEELLKAGCNCSRLDQSVFTYHDADHQLQGLLMSHVDDFLWAGNPVFKQNVIHRIKSIFKISSENSAVFKYVGIKIQQGDNGILISQNEYAQEIDEIEIDPSRLKEHNEPLNEEEKSSLRSVIGQLNWLSTQTRPDIAYDVCDLSTNLKDGSVSLLKQANRVIKRAKLRDVNLHYPKMNLNNLSVECHADASHGNLKGGGSQGGMFIEVRSGDYSCPVEWQSKKLRRAAKSTLAAETIAMVESMENAIYISSLLKEILSSSTGDIPINCFTDNYSLFQTAHSTTSISDKRLRIELAILREALNREDVTLSWVKSQEQLADCLTKKGCDDQRLIARITHGAV